MSIRINCSYGDSWLFSDSTVRHVKKVHGDKAKALSRNRPERPSYFIRQDYIDLIRRTIEKGFRWTRADGVTYYYHEFPFDIGYFSAKDRTSRRIKVCMHQDRVKTAYPIWHFELWLRILVRLFVYLSLLFNGYRDIVSFRFVLILSIIYVYNVCMHCFADLY